MIRFKRITSVDWLTNMFLESKQHVPTFDRKLSTIFLAVKASKLLEAERGERFVCVFGKTLVNFKLAM